MRRSTLEQPKAQGSGREKLGTKGRERTLSVADLLEVIRPHYSKRAPCDCYRCRAFRELKARLEIPDPEWMKAGIVINPEHFETYSPWSRKGRKP